MAEQRQNVSYVAGDLDSLTIEFLECSEQPNHRIYLNCGLKMLIDLDDVAAFQLLSPCHGALVKIGETEPTVGAKESGYCEVCEAPCLSSFGPMALEPSAGEHVFQFTPELRPWLAEQLMEYMSPMESICLAKPLESVIQSYLDAGSGVSSEHLREVYSDNVMELYQHPITGGKK